MKTIPSGLKAGWWSVELPGYRSAPLFSTYTLFPYDDLPPIHEVLDSHFDWLKAQPPQEDSLAKGGDAGGSRPDLNKLTSIIANAGVRVPDTFLTFMQSPELQQRVRSCTDCYLDVHDFAVKTLGSLNGYLIHFLSDSQWVFHWYLHVDASGGECVLVSGKAYGFQSEHTDGRREIDLSEEEIWYCSPSFAEFTYRFWIENEIWYALADNLPLTTSQQAYVTHYSR